MTVQILQAVHFLTPIWFLDHLAHRDEGRRSSNLEVEAAEGMPMND